LLPIGKQKGFTLLEISFKNKRLRKLFESAPELQRKYGNRVARTIMMRIGVLKEASHLGEVPTTKPERCHQLKANRDEQFAVDLVHPNRLVFVSSHNPTPRNDDGGINKHEVKAITIIEVVDYH
jgi:plasmid maintenance system killer protein